jgi:hypothetical protein
VVRQGPFTFAHDRRPVIERNVSDTLFASFPIPSNDGGATHYIIVLNALERHPTVSYRGN